MTFQARPGRSMFQPIRHAGGGLSPKAETTFNEILKQLIILNHKPTLMKSGYYGPAGVGTYPLLTIIGKGIILGGNFNFTKNSAQLKFTFDDETPITSSSIDSLYQQELFSPNIDLLYVVRYDDVNYNYRVGLSPGYNFETKLKIEAVFSASTFLSYLFYYVLI